MTDTLLHVDGLKTQFLTERGLVRAVDGVSFELEHGKALGIVGESGSGKTVLSRSIMGLLPDSARHEGSVHYDGRELLTMDRKQRRALWGREMSMVFQNPMVSLNPVMKIGRQLMEPLRIHLQLERKQARDRAVELLEQVHIPEPARRIDQYPHELSGGMRQRVMIAIAIAAEPRVLFADEPTTALDVTVQAQILDLIQEQQRLHNMSVILVTHDLGVVARYTDEIAVMYGGQLVEKAPTKSLFSDMKMPYTKSLLRSIPNVEDPSHTRLQAISGRPPDLVKPPTGCRFAPRCAYAREKCTAEAPPLRPAESPEHVYACWYPVGSPEFIERDEQVTAQLEQAEERIRSTS